MRSRILREAKFDADVTGGRGGDGRAKLPKEASHRVSVWVRALPSASECQYGSEFEFALAATFSCSFWSRRESESPSGSVKEMMCGLRWELVCE